MLVKTCLNPVIIVSNLSAEVESRDDLCLMFLWFQRRELWTQWTSMWSKESRSESCGHKEIHHFGNLGLETSSSKIWTSPLTTRPYMIPSLLSETSCPARWGVILCLRKLEKLIYTLKVHYWSFGPLVIKKQNCIDFAKEHCTYT